MGVATLAVLFTDLVGSTEHAERLGPAAADEARRRHFDALRSAVRAHGGQEVKSTGDGLMVVFASPSDAVACAGAMQASARHGDAGAGAGLRVGVSIGEVTEEDGDWYGLPVVRAARLCAAAAPTQVLVDQLVAALAGRASATFEPVGDLDLKGLAQPVTTLELRWLDSTAVLPLPTALARTGVTPFVGRVEPLDVLEAAWGRASAGETVTVLVGGEPGTGKTSLAGAFARQVHERGAALVLFGRCDEGPGLAYQPFAQALGHYVGHADPAVLAQHVAVHGGDLHRVVPELGVRIGSLPPPTTADPASEQFHLFRSVHGLLRTAGQDVPVLLVLDDLHWAGKPTLQLLQHLLRVADPAPMLVLATYRDTELGRTHPLADALAELRSLDAVARLRLRGLDAAETEALVEAAAGHDLDDRGRALAGEVHARSEGNPFFVLELLRHLAESGRIERSRGRWRAGATITDADLPEGVRDVVGRRLRRLPDDTNRALLLAAVSGLEFEAAVVADAAGVDVHELLDLLDPAVEGGIVGEVGAGRFAFTHALIRSTVQDEAGVSRRAHLHGVLAASIERVHAADLDPWLAALAVHHAEAANPQRTTAAVEFALRAGAHALGQAAADEAVVHLERGLGAARLAEPPDDRQIARLHVALAETTAMQDPQTGRAHATEAAAAAERAGDADLLAAAAASMWSVFQTSTAGVTGGDPWLPDLCARALAASPGTDPAVRARRLAMQVLMTPGAGGDSWAVEAEPAVALAAAGADPTATVLAAAAQLQVESMSAPTVRAWERFLGTVDAVYETTDDHQLRGMVAVYQSWGASWYGDRGRFAQAEERAAAAGAVLAGQRIPSWSCWMAAQTALREGRWDDALAASARAREISPDPALGQGMFLLQTGTSLVQRGVSLPPGEAGGAASSISMGGDVAAAFVVLFDALAGDTDGVRARLPDLLDRFQRPGFAMRIPTTGLAAWAAVIAGDRASVPRLEAALTPYRGIVLAGGLLDVASVDRVLGDLAALDGRLDDADELYRTGLALEEGFGARAWTVHTRYHWARVLLDRDRPADRDQAVDLLDECLATAVALGMDRVVDGAGELRRRAAPPAR